MLIGVDGYFFGILDAWNAFTFDPAKANGAKKETVLTGMIANRCKMAMRGLVRNRTRDNQHGEALMANQDDHPLRRDIPLQIDVRDALSGLSEQERFICEALSNDVPQQEIIERFGLTWYRLQEMVENIKTRFAALGLHQWLEE